LSWETIYNFLGITEFIYFISSPELQEQLLLVKLIFITFAMFFLGAVIYFMVNSTWVQYHFLEDVTEFFSWQPYGIREFTRRLQKIRKRMEIGTETELKLAIIEADDLLAQLLDDRGYEGKTFEDVVRQAGGVVGNQRDVFEAHSVRNSIVYDPNFALDEAKAKEIINIYENAIKSIAAS